MGPRTSDTATATAISNGGSTPEPGSDTEEFESDSDGSTYSWREEAINGGTLRHVDLDKGSNGWASPPGDLFHLRAKGYFSRRKKAPSGDWLLKPAGVDWLRSPARVDHVLARSDNRVINGLRRAKRLGVAKKGSFIFAVNLQVPARPDAYSAVFYFASEGPIQPDSLLHKFVFGDDAYRNSRFKLVNRIVKGPWLVKAAVGNYAACLLGKALPIKYYKGEDYFEIDVDIGSSAIASAILSIALGCVTSVTIDMGFVVEAQQEEELPERLIGAVRIAQMEMKSACFIPVLPAPDPADWMAAG